MNNFFVYSQQASRAKQINDWKKPSKSSITNSVKYPNWLPTNMVEDFNTKLLERVQQAGRGRRGAWTRSLRIAIDPSKFSFWIIIFFWETTHLHNTYFSLRGCLHDTGATFAPARVHSGSLSWLYICFHDTTTKCHSGASHPGRSSPRLLYRGENFTPVRNLATVSCKRETTTVSA